MIRIVVVRGPHSADSTPGQLIVNNEFECFTLEDTYRKEKIKHETRIPAGLYKARLHPRSKFQPRYRKMFGPKHEGMLMLTSVPEFTGILIHMGNRSVDTSGCILVGEEQDIAHDEIRRSKDAYRRVIVPVIARMARGERCTVEVM